jgi:GT2 family glycosyltransferase
MRPLPLLKLLKSIKEQTLYPNEILIIDGSTNSETEELLKENTFLNLQYCKVNDKDRGLTKQRNYGISKVSSSSKIICFLDDDTILEKNYFQNLLETYKQYPEALGVGGYIINQVKWGEVKAKTSSSKFFYDGWERKEPFRFMVRSFFGLQPDTPPCFLPKFSHGRSVGFLPPSGKIYEVEQFMGGVSSFRKEIFEQLSFSNYFEGYGLYEDADFTLRLSKLGKLYVNTTAQLEHHHDDSGRPNKFKYGKMVARNGWYVWRVKHPNPELKARLKWNLTFILLMKLRFLNVLTTRNRYESFTEAMGRLVGWLSLIFNKPKVEA